MISMKTKSIAKEIRERFKSDGVSNRNIRVLCRQSSHGRCKYETIYVVVCIHNEALYSYCEPIIKDYAKQYSGGNLSFIYVRDTGTMGLIN